MLERRRFAFGVVAAVVWSLIAWFVVERGSKGFLLRREFAEAASVGSAFESVATDGVDGVCFVFGVDETRAIIYVVDFRCFDVVFGSAVLVEVMVGRLRCFLC